MSAHRLGWGPPGLDQTKRVLCPGIQLNVRPAVVPLFAELVRWLAAERIKHGAPALDSSGGYNKRLVRGSATAWSNHSWGLAADFNAATNPMSSTLRTDMPPGTSAKAKSLGMRWGGDYEGRKDPMHFEVNVTPEEAARIVLRLRTTSAVRTTPPPTPVQEDDMAASFTFNDGKKTYWRDGGDTVWVPEQTDVAKLHAGGVKDLGRFSAEFTARLVEAAKQ